MDLILDGESRRFDTSECANLAELVSLADTLDRPQEDSVVVAVAVDGETLSPESLAALEGHPLEGVREVAIERRPTRAVACSVLDQGADYAERISETVNDCVQAFRAGKNGEGNEVLAAVTDSFMVLIGLTQSAAGVLTESTASLAGLQESLVPWLQELVEAQSAADPLRIADLLEYEIAPLIEEWGRVLRAVAASAQLPGAADVSS